MEAVGRELLAVGVGSFGLALGFVLSKVRSQAVQNVLFFSFSDLLLHLRALQAVIRQLDQFTDFRHRLEPRSRRAERRLRVRRP